MTNSLCIFIVNLGLVLVLNHAVIFAWIEIEHLSNLNNYGKVVITIQEKLMFYFFISERQVISLFLQEREYKNYCDQSLLLKARPTLSCTPAVEWQDNLVT